jgi:peptide alpha-N-acetyltransferase
MMQHTNLRCLPENYNLRYFLYHYISWPQLLYVQEDYNGNVVGYVLSKMDDEEDPKKSHGHVTSLAVLRTHRKLGVASNVMNMALKCMEGVFDANYCSLHVRRTNEAAIHLYQQTLGFRCFEIDEKYYVDDEDAFHMKKHFKPTKEPQHLVTEGGTLVRITAAAAAAAAAPAAPASVTNLPGKVTKHSDPQSASEATAGANESTSNTGKGKSKGKKGS